MHWFYRLRWGRVITALLLVGAVIFAAYHYVNKDKAYQPQENYVETPVDYTTDIWDQLLGGDEELTDEDFQELDKASNSDLNTTDANTLKTLGRNVLVADLTGRGRESWDGYWTDNTSAVCENIAIKATSPMKLPTTSGSVYAKILIVWEGTCQEEIYPDGVNVSYIYAQKTGDDWNPVREWKIPTETTMEAVPVNGPESFELKNLSKCGNENNTNFQARIMVADAWDLLCQAARKDGVLLEVRSAYRTQQEQQSLYQEALKFYGSEREANRWVAPADENSCSSKHCDGAAVSIKSDTEALDWLNQVVGCRTNGEISMNQTVCPEGSDSIKRLQTYGFVAPSPLVPTYLEFYLPLATEQASANCNPVNSNVPTMIAEIFRCRLQEAGLGTEEIQKTVQEALVVGRCESSWNSLAVAFGGKFRDETHPVTGRTYTQAGVFMLDKSEADTFLPKGYEQVSDPVENINGAARLWLTTRDWSQWGCATGKGELFETGPVLPQYGGPELPSWSSEY